MTLGKHLKKKMGTSGGGSSFKGIEGREGISHHYQVQKRARFFLKRRIPKEKSPTPIAGGGI